MTTQPEIVRQSELLNQLVIDRNTMEELGRVELLWMYPQTHRVLGFICKSGFLGSKKLAFKLAQIEARGVNGILTHSQPEETDSGKVRQLVSLLHHQVWSDAGNKIGSITDCLFNLQTGAITQYLFVSSGWAGITGEVYQLPPTMILSFGVKRVLVKEAAVTTFAVYREGIQQKLTKAGDFLKQEATQEWELLAQQTQAATQQASGRLNNLAGQAKERAQSLSNQTRKKAQTLSGQFKEGTQTWLEQAKEKSQDLVEQVKERTEPLGKQVKEGIQTPTVQPEETFDSVTEETPNASPTVPPAPSSNTKKSTNPTTLEDDDDEPWI